MEQPIYLDYNATTPIDKEVAGVMKPFLEEHFGNPSSIHLFGVTAKKAIMEARSQVAGLIRCKPPEIIFTSGGTESNNMAIKGIAEAFRGKGNHIITSAIEHPAVTQVCAWLSERGYDITYVPVDEFGMVDPAEVRKIIKPSTILISIMHANNEVGTIQPIAEISRIAREFNILVHTDAAQSVGKILVDVQELGVDLLSVAGHKFYAPKGVGALYIREGLTLPKMIHGADHEMNLRAGTENVLEIVGLGKACEIAAKNLEKNSKHLESVTKAFYEGLKYRIPSIRINGHPVHRLPNTLSVSFPGIEAHTLLGELSQVAASAGAACHTDKIDVSAVLQAMKIPQENALGTIRFSTGKYTTLKEINRAVEYISIAVKKLKKDDRSVEVPMGEKIRLTQFTHGLGCACKIRPQYLENILKDLPVPVDPNILVSLSSSDDAAVYRVNDNTAVIQTVDFFTPIVDDPYYFGVIAAANALSDIYAMGGKPVFALNIVGFPDKRLPADVLKSILRGASDKVQEAGVHILGGHTIEDTEPKFGMTVTGFADPAKIITNAGMQPGDALVLTKPIGLGIIATAMKRGLAGQSMTDEAILIMSELNKVAAELMLKYHATACTDITGFGLFGHLREMTLASGADVEIYSGSIPVIHGVEELVSNDVVPGGTFNNLEYVTNHVNWGLKVSPIEKIIFCDAQTSGGLLIALPYEQHIEFINELKKQGISAAACIGRCVNKGVGKIILQKK